MHPFAPWACSVRRWTLVASIGDHADWSLGRRVVEEPEFTVGSTRTTRGARYTHTREGSMKESASHDVYVSPRPREREVVYAPLEWRSWRCFFVLSPRFLNEMAWRPLIRACYPGGGEVVVSRHTHR